MEFFTSGRQRGAIWFAINALMVTLGVALSGIAGELVLRLGGFESRFAHEWLTPYPRFYFRADEKSGFDIAENYPTTDFRLMEYRRLYNTFFEVWSNALGCFDYPYTPTDRLIYLVGDSFTWGYVPFDKTWGTILERETAARVLKCGVPGYGTHQQQMKIERLLQSTSLPKLIIIGYFVGNDVMDDYLFPNYTVHEGYWADQTEFNAYSGQKRSLTPSEIEERFHRFVANRDRVTTKVKKYLIRHSELFNALRHSPILRQVAYRFGIAGLGGPSRAEFVFQSSAEFPWLEDAWTRHIRNLQAIHRLGQRLAVKVLFVIIPTPEQVYDELRQIDTKAAWEMPNEKLKDFFKAEHIDFVDLLPDFKRYAEQYRTEARNSGHSLYWPYNRHLNVQGNRLAGLLVAQHLMDRNILGPAERHESGRIKDPLSELASQPTASHTERR